MQSYRDPRWFCRNRNTDSKIQMKPQRTQNSQSNLTLPNFKTPVQNSTLRQQTEAGTRKSLLKRLADPWQGHQGHPTGKVQSPQQSCPGKATPPHTWSKNLSVRAKNKTNKSDFTKFDLCISEHYQEGKDLRGHEKTRTSHLCAERLRYIKNYSSIW